MSKTSQGEALRYLWQHGEGLQVRLLKEIPTDSVSYKVAGNEVHLVVVSLSSVAALEGKLSVRKKEQDETHGLTLCFKSLATNLPEGTIPLAISRATKRCQSQLTTFLDKHGKLYKGKLLFVALADEPFQLLCENTKQRQGQETVADTEEEPDELKHRYIGKSPRAKLIRYSILNAAMYDRNVLIIGESGTGKEVIAKAIHDYYRQNLCKCIADGKQVGLLAHKPAELRKALFYHIGTREKGRGRTDTRPLKTPLTEFADSLHAELKRKYHYKLGDSSWNAYLEEVRKELLGQTGLRSSKKKDTAEDMSRLEEVADEFIARHLDEFDIFPRVEINCAAVTKELLEAELFGVKGKVATGVDERIGLWEQAMFGTLFLDEIGEMQPYHQPKVLRALEERRIRTVGGEEERPVFARIISATNRKLVQLLDVSFRNDLYQRLNQVEIYTSPLRDHLEDVPLLAVRMWEKMQDMARGAGPELPEVVLEELQKYSYPGNVRELESILHTMFAHNLEKKTVTVAHLYQEMSTKCITRASLSWQDEEACRLGHALQHLERVKTVLDRIIFELSWIFRDESPEAILKDLKGVLHDLSFLLAELDMYTQRTIFFINQQLFQKVLSLRGELSLFHELLPGYLEESQLKWKRGLKSMLESVRREVKEEMDALVEQRLRLNEE